MTLNRHQQIVLPELYDEGNLLVYKPRQVGMSELISYYLAQRYILGVEKNKKILLVSFNSHINKISFERIERYESKCIEIMNKLGVEYKNHEDELRTLKNFKNKSVTIGNNNEIFLSDIDNLQNVILGRRFDEVIFDEAFYIFDEKILNNYLAFLNKVTIFHTKSVDSRELNFSCSDSFKVINLRWWEDERFTSDSNSQYDLVWQKDGQEIVETDPKMQSIYFQIGWKPTSSWYRTMSNMISEKRVRYEYNGV
jgi:hypothetical protein